MKVKLVTTELELQAVFDIRIEVFVKEQGVPLKDELDEHEKTAEHVIAYYDDKIHTIDDAMFKFYKDWDVV